MISPLIPPDDLARQLSLEELEEAAGLAAANGPLLICSASSSALAAARDTLGGPRADAMLRELVLFARRNLRGSDAVAIAGDELVLLLDQSARASIGAAERLVSAVRSHVFSAGGGEHPQRLTLAVGAAQAPDHGSTFRALLAAARAARASVHDDGVAEAFTPHVQGLDLSRFVGRTEPLLQLTDQLDDIVRGVGRVVAIVGERGVGKSAVVRALIPEVRLRGGSLVCATNRAPVLVTPYGMWIDLLRAIRRLPVKSTRTWQQLHLLDPSLEHVVSNGSIVGNKTQLQEELADYIRLVAQQRPLVILLENMQDADAASWDALEYVILQLESERVLFALTLPSDEEDDARSRWDRIAVRPRHSEIRLTNLTRDDVKRYLEIALHTSEVGRDFLAYVYRHSEGNPLVVLHLLRDLEEGGHLVQRDGTWRSSPPADLPAQVSLDELLARRISRLAPDERAIIDAVSITARESEPEMLAGITRMSPENLGIHLDRLLERGLLVPTYDRGQPAYSIAQDEIARTARSRVLAENRADLHRRVAVALAAQPQYAPAEIAWHFERAGDRDNAYLHALRAADNALAVHETGAAAELLVAAERSAPSERALAEVRIRMAELAEMSGRYEEVESLCGQALAWCEEHGDPATSLRLQRMAIRVRMQRGQAASDTLKAFLALEEQARSVNADAERAAILLQISMMHWRLGDVRAAQRVAAECVAIAETGSDALLISDSCNRLAVTIQLENAPRARQLFERSLDIATAAADAVRQVRAMNNIGVLDLISGNWDDAKKMLTHAAEQARTSRLLEWWGRAELNLGVLAGRVGDHEGSARALSEALRLTSVVQNGEEQLYATYNMAHLERERLRFREAEDTYALVAELAQRIGQVEVQVGALAGLGLCRFLSGNVAGARVASEGTSRMLERLHEWFQGRELAEGLAIHLMLVDGAVAEAGRSFTSALKLAAPSDTYGAAWLTAEFGPHFKEQLSEEVAAAVREYARRPEVMANPRMRDRLSVLNADDLH